MCGKLIEKYAKMIDYTTELLTKIILLRKAKLNRQRTTL